jgi:hypothetical protein
MVTVRTKFHWLEDIPSFKSDRIILLTSHLNTALTSVAFNYLGLALPTSSFITLILASL